MKVFKFILVSCILIINFISYMEAAPSSTFLPRRALAVEGSTQGPVGDGGYTWNSDHFLDPGRKMNPRQFEEVVGPTKYIG